MTPELGLTQYFLGAVVFILKQTVESVGLINLRLDVIIEVNGPEINMHNNFMAR